MHDNSNRSLGWLRWLKLKFKKVFIQRSTPLKSRTNNSLPIRSYFSYLYFPANVISCETTTDIFSLKKILIQLNWSTNKQCSIVKTSYTTKVQQSPQVCWSGYGTCFVMQVTWYNNEIHTGFCHTLNCIGVADVTGGVIHGQAGEGKPALL